MTKKERFLRVAAALEQLYPDARCSLFSGNAFELLVAVRLSAQCTDARVNQVTPALFAKYPTLEDYCNADVSDIEKLIYSCGFYKTKAENIIEMARKVRDDYDGRVPDTIEDLLTLPGVGRKTANLIVGDVYGKESVVVDTHMIRIANRLHCAVWAGYLPGPQPQVRGVSFGRRHLPPGGCDRQKVKN